MDDNRLESVGSCSWRNLLDGPIDSGYLDGHPDLWVCGVRRDVKRAPASLVRAETARAVADYLQTCGGKASKERIREIGSETRHNLAMLAQPVPQHGLLAVDMASAITLWDGPSSATGWAAVACGGELVYVGEHSDFLAWLVWSGLNSVQSLMWPVGDVAFLDPDGNGAKYIGAKDLPELLASWAGRATIRRSTLKVVVGDLVSDVELSSAGLKVCSISFPEEVCASRDLEARLKERIEYLMTFEATLAALFAEFWERRVSNDFPAEFLPLLKAEPSEVEDGSSPS